MSTQSKYKYSISSNLSADIPVVTPAASPAAPILDYLTPVDNIIYLNVQEFTARGVPRAGHHPTAVFHTGHSPKLINYVSATGIELQQLAAQQTVMNNIFSEILDQMEDLKDTINPGQPDDVSQLSSESLKSNSTNGRARRSTSSISTSRHSRCSCWGANPRPRSWKPKPKPKRSPVTHP